jgi:hypothetical protein
VLFSACRVTADVPGAFCLPVLMPPCCCVYIPPGDLVLGRLRTLVLLRRIPFSPAMPGTTQWRLPYYCLGCLCGCLCVRSGFWFAGSPCVHSIYWVLYLSAEQVGAAFTFYITLYYCMPSVPPAVCAVPGVPPY